MHVGTMILTMITFLSGFFCICALLSGDVRLLSAGYNSTSCRYGAIAGAAGVVFGLIGILGCYNKHAGQLRLYNVYQVIKLAVSAYVFVMDYLQLQFCQMHGKVIQSQIEFNAPMEALSKKGLCEWGMHSYLIGAVIHLCFDCYCTYVTFVYCERMAKSKSYLISFGEDLGIDGVVPYSSSMGECAHLLTIDCKSDLKMPRGYSSTGEKKGDMETMAEIAEEEANNLINQGYDGR